MPKLDVSVTAATYNESENIQLLIEKLESEFKKAKLKGEIIVIDDNSPDGTADIVSKLSRKWKNIVLIKRKGRLGIGSAHKAGIQRSKGRIIVTMDADLSHPPNALPKLVEKANKGFIVSGSRFLDKGSFSTKTYRKLGTLSLSFVIRLLLNTGVKDNSNGYVAVERKNLDKILKAGTKISIDPFDKILYGIPLFAIARKLNIHACEVPAPYVFRKKGITKIGFFNGLKITLEGMLYSFKLSLLLSRLKPQDSPQH